MRIGVRDEVGKRLVIDLDGIRRFFRAFFRVRREGHNLLPGPEHFLPFRHDNHDALHARHLFRRAGVDFRDFGVRVRRNRHFAPEHSRAIDVVGIFRPARRLFGAVDPLDALADERTMIRRGPVIIRH